MFRQTIGLDMWYLSYLITGIGNQMIKIFMLKSKGLLLEQNWGYSAYNTIILNIMN